jgi:hypothetical protein
MAIEDSYSLGILLTHLSTNISLSNAVAWWQKWRSKRLDQVLALTIQLGNLRFPVTERAAIAKGFGLEDIDLIRNAGK